ncbi:hypothetical protein OS122_02450 [Mycolicibacterium mucogenicum]|uniref:hypothetical protein n=1 Tax=Mycolicibacterium mucogenicum TaxID=56689 RepID=UPI002269BBA5|nr:hypothetical protein [Mycolicibacterium mucogenicum]MCX8559759.1 hypothetical protein [Mycolicibacterium mucogenicum]
MTDLPSFTIDPTTRLRDIIGSAVGTTLTTEALEKTRVVFSSNIQPNSLIVFDGDIYRAPAKVYAEVGTDGTIRKAGNPVVLLANDAALSVSNVQWTVTIMVPTPSGPQLITPWTFDAPASGTVEDLSTTVPVALVGSVGVVRGPKGDPVDGVALIDGELVFYVDGAPIGSPVDFVSATGHTYAQASPAATWIIANPLGRPARSVNVYIGGDQVDADVTAPNDSTSPITVTFATPQTGRAEIS